MYRFPETAAELLLSAESRLLFTSSYLIQGIVGSLKLDIVVRDKNGSVVKSCSYRQTDRTERKYGVTFKKDSRY